MLGSDYDVITPDALGHGQSTWHGPVSVDDWVSSLHGTVGTRPVHVVGLSMGGLQAIAFAAAQPELVRSVTIANSFARLPADVADARINDCTQAITQHGMPTYARHYLEQTLTQSIDQADHDALFTAISTMTPDAYLAAAETTFRADLVPMLAQVSCPALVITGELDAKVPEARTAELLSGLADARLEIIPAAGHLSCVENPGDFSAALTRFLTHVGERAAIH